jgi:hypothetical protein
MYYLIFGMLKDMVIKLRFEIYQSEGTVEYGPNEIILRPCSSESGQNRANQIVRLELLSISNTNEWKIYINEDLEHCGLFTMLVRHHAKAQPIVEIVIEEEQVQGDAEGKVDEGGRIPVLIEQTEREDEEGVLVYNGIDDSNKEGDTIPVEWRQTGFSKYSVVDTHEREWEYR